MCSRPILLRGSLKIEVDYLRNVSRFVSSSGYYAPFSLNALSTPMDFLFHVPADCHQICKNNPGSYSCSCFGGYQLSSDGKSCLGESLGKTLVILTAVCCRSIVFLGPKNMQCTRILIFLNPQLFLCRFGFRPYVSGESGIRIRNFFNPLSWANGTFLRRYESGMMWTLNPDISFIRWRNKIEPSS